MDPDFVTMLFYFFSTVAQTLAAAFAFAGAFAVYNMQRLAGYRDQAAKQLLELHPNPTLEAFYDGRRWGEFLGFLKPHYMEKGVPVNAADGNALERAVQSVVNIQKLYADIVRFRKLGDTQHDLLRRGLKYTVVAVMASLILLPLTSPLARYPASAIIIVVLLLFFSALQLHCVYRIMVLVAVKSSEIDRRAEDSPPKVEYSQEGFSAVATPPELD